MFNLILKDLFIIKNKIKYHIILNLMLIVLLYVACVPITLILYTYANMVMIFLPGSYLNSLVEYEENRNLYRLLDCLPIEREKIVWSKYISAFGTALTILSLSCLVLGVISILNNFVNIQYDYFNIKKVSIGWLNGGAAFELLFLLILISRLFSYSILFCSKHKVFYSTLFLIIQISLLFSYSIIVQLFYSMSLFTGVVSITTTLLLGFILSIKLATHWFEKRKFY